MNDEDFERLPPHDITAEQGVVGGMLLSQTAIGEVIELVGAVDFYRPAHQVIFDTVLDLYGRGEPADAVTVAGELTKRGEISRVGGAPYLHTLISSVPTAASAGYYARIVRERSLLRKLIETGTRIAQMGYATDGVDAEQAAETAQKLLDDATLGVAESSARSVADLVGPFMEALEAGGDQRGVASGWVDLARLVPRFRPGQLVTIGARPGMGKSVALACIAHYVGVKLGLPVLINTLEMSTDEFMARLVAHDAKVNLGRLLEPGQLTEDDWERMARSHARFSEAGTLLIDDTPGMSIPHVRAALRQMRRQGKPAALVIVDYLQLMESDRKVESRQVEVSKYSRGFKLLAKEFEVPIIVGSQLNRDVERRADKKPTLADLRESGSVEQDSDIVIMLHREDAYDPESTRAGEIDLHVEKNRNGPKGVVTLAFQGHYARVVDMAPRDTWTPHGVVS